MSVLKQQIWSFNKQDNMNRNFQWERKRSRKVIVKIELKQKNKKDGITVEILLNTRMIELAISSEYIKKHKSKTKLKRPIYVRNMNGIFNHKWLIEHKLNIMLFYKIYKKRTKIDVIWE